MINAVDMLHVFFSEPERKSGFSVVLGSLDANEAAIYTPRLWAQTHTNPNLRDD